MNSIAFSGSLLERPFFSIFSVPREGDLQALLIKKAGNCVLYVSVKLSVDRNLYPWCIVSHLSWNHIKVTCTFVYYTYLYFSLKISLIPFVRFGIIFQIRLDFRLILKFKNLQCLY